MIMQMPNYQSKRCWILNQADRLAQEIPRNEKQINSSLGARTHEQYLDYIQVKEGWDENTVVFIAKQRLSLTITGIDQDVVITK